MPTHYKNGHKFKTVRHGGDILVYLEVPGSAETPLVFVLDKQGTRAFNMDRVEFKSWYPGDPIEGARYFWLNSGEGQEPKEKE